MEQLPTCRERLLEALESNGRITWHAADARQTDDLAQLAQIRQKAERYIAEHPPLAPALFLID